MRRPTKLIWQHTYTQLCNPVSHYTLSLNNVWATYNCSREHNTVSPPHTHHNNIRFPYAAQTSTTPRSQTHYKPRQRNESQQSTTHINNTMLSQITSRTMLTHISQTVTPCTSSISDLNNTNRNFKIKSFREINSTQLREEILFAPQTPTQNTTTKNAHYQSQTTSPSIFLYGCCLSHY